MSVEPRDMSYAMRASLQVNRTALPSSAMYQDEDDACDIGKACRRAPMVLNRSPYFERRAAVGRVAARWCGHEL